MDGGVEGWVASEKVCCCTPDTASSCQAISFSPSRSHDQMFDLPTITMFRGFPVSNAMAEVMKA
jgi:hypothetical protein